MKPIRFLLIAVICILAGSGIALGQCVQPPSGMVAWWPGDNNTNDIINGNNGTLTGGATYGSGKVTGAFLLANDGDYVEVNDDPTLDFGTGDLTIDAWIKTSSTILDFSTIVDKRDGNYYGYMMFISNDGRLAIEFKTSTQWLGWVSNNFNHLKDGDWHHVAIAVERNSPTGGKMYVDGQLDYTFDPTTLTSDISNSGHLCIGRLCGG